QRQWENDDEPPLSRRSSAMRDRRSRSSTLPWIVAGVFAGVVLLGGLAGLGAWLLLARKVEVPSGTGAVAEGPLGAEQRTAAAGPDAPPGQPVVLQPPPTQAGVHAGEGGLAAETLQTIKNATVFIKVPKGGRTGFGSGFVLSVNGDTGYVVTNHHVVTATQQVPAFGFPPPPMFPEIPFGPFGPVFPDPDLFPVPRNGQVQVQKVTVVFFSGTAQEMSLQGDVIVAVKEPDLPLIKVAQVKNLPKAFDCSKSPPLTETMP